MTPAFLEALEQQPWKGNIRELRNVIERSLIVCEGGRLDICDLPLEIQNTHYECSDDNIGSFELAAMERRHIARVLEIYERQQDGNCPLAEDRSYHFVQEDRGIQNIII